MFKIELDISIVFRTISIVMIVSSCLIFYGCHTNKGGIQSLDDNTLRTSVEGLVNCLNEHDKACLKKLYASDFESYSPVLESPDVEELVHKTVDNLATNDYQIGVDIQEVQQGKDLGFVILNWRILEMIDGSYKNLMNEKRMDIWKKNKDGQWQLYRSLFYKENMF